MFQNICVRAFTRHTISRNLNYLNLRTSRRFHKSSVIFVRQGRSNDIPSPAIASKYRIINEENSFVIEDTVDENNVTQLEIDNDEFEGLNLKSKLCK